MDNTLQQLCDLQLENEEYVRNTKLMAGEEYVKIGALLCTSSGFRPDIEIIKSCKDILKQKTKKFSDFHGSLGTLLSMKMSIAQSPGSYIDGIVSIYNKIIEGKIFSSYTYILTAMIINDRCLAGDIDADAITAKTFTAFKELTKGNPFSDEWYIPYLALTVTEDRDLDSMIKEINDSYKVIKKDHRLPGEIAMSAGILLTSSPKPVEEKAADFCNLYEAIKKHKCHTSTSKAMSIYTTYVDLNEDRDTLINSIVEVNEYFKGKKGYGMLSGTDDLRKSLAASLVLKYYMKSASDQSTSIISAIITEEVLYIAIAAYMLIIAPITFQS
ncbi:MAG: DUF4003 domain-containing protein [Lachnospiraceae bacterium]|nr:DUF4003 domain-containing protein [Lachnospiraceae bacterium]